MPTCFCLTLCGSIPGDCSMARMLNGAQLKTHASHKNEGILMVN